MIKDITLGQYVPGDSIVHKADPRTKIGLSFLYIISIFFVRDPLVYLLSALYLGVVVYYSTIPYKIILRGLRPLRVLILITFLLNVLFAGDGTIIFQFWILRITQEGLNLAIHFSLRLIFLVLGTSVLTLSTSPIAISDGIELLMKPLKRFKFPVHELAMMMTIALRFIPTLMEETDKIMKAQISRGADFESGNIIQRAKAMIPLLVPLFVSAFRRANELAMAMEARCYHGDDHRTRYRVLQFSKLDTYCILVSLAYFGFILLFYFIR